MGPSRSLALAAVIAGVGLFTLGVLGMARVDARLEVAATAQQVAAAKHQAAAKLTRAAARPGPRGRRPRAPSA